MTDFSEARNAYCRRCGTWFCPEDGGCACEEEIEEELDSDGEPVRHYSEDDWREDR